MSDENVVSRTSRWDEARVAQCARTWFRTLLFPPFLFSPTFGDSCISGNAGHVAVLPGNSPRHYAYIDALRGWAILGVIVFHVSQYFPGLEYPLRTIVGEGARGVQLFFVISALSLMLSWHRRADGIAPFYVRRFFRIAPMFWLAILFFVALDGFGPRQWAPAGISWWQVVVTALFLHGWHPESINSVVPGGWSIAVEMTFYALFPLLVIACSSLARTIAVLLLSVLAAAAVNGAAAVILEPAPPHQPQYLIDAFRFFWFWSQLPVFLIGILVYFAASDKRRHLPIFWANLGVYASVLILVILPFVEGRSLLLDHIKCALCFGLLAFCLACGAKTFVVNKLSCFIGKVSFSCYLWHFAVLVALFDRLLAAGVNPFGLNDAAHGWSYFLQFFAVVAAATIALSFVTYRLVEQPMIRIGSRIAASIKPVFFASLRFSLSGARRAIE
jgi:peptidoglycan/LPS O-acetylase OafA/YrhL